MPEPNRKLVDFMYEAAWRILFEYRYGYPQDKVPAPWYDEVNVRQDHEGNQGESMGKC